MKVLALIVDGYTGYSQAGASLALALDAAGADVACRHLRLNDPSPPSGRLKALLEKPRLAGGFDVCLQVMLPHQMRPHGDLPTAGYFFWETDHFKTSSWARHLDRLDRVIVPAGNTREACLRSGVHTDIEIIPLPCDVGRYERSYEPLKAVQAVRDRGEFVFYSLGEFTRRKNYRDLLTAYYAEFSRGEPVHMVLKCHKPGVGREEFEREFARWNDKLLASLKLHRDPDRYPPVTLVNQALSDEEVLRLHSSCDCFVQASYGEGWSVPGFDSMALGKTPIVPRHTGYLAWASDDVGWTVGCSPTPCSGVIDSFADLYRADEAWWQPDVGGLRHAMRCAFAGATPVPDMRWAARQVKARAGAARAYDYSYEAIGPRLLEALARCASSRNPSG